MSKFIRIIPKLDIKGNSLVKGINLEGLRVLGSPIDFAKYYFLNNADEIIYQDVVASLYSRDNFLHLIQDTAKEIFIPLTVGGGIRSLKDIYQILRAGADKVSINTAAINKPQFLYEAIHKYGASTIVSSIELVRSNDKYFAYTDNGRNNSNIEAIEWIKQINEIKPGEIIATFVNSEGTGDGLDLSFLEKILNITNIPIIVHGGLGNKNQILEIIKNYNINGIAIASMFHYHAYNKFDSIKSLEGNVDFLEKKNKKLKVEHISINDLKDFLIKNNKNIRV